MQIISDFHKDTQSEKLKPGSYEWWYFDLMSSNGYSLVVIFYDGNPFSRRYIDCLESNNRVNASDFPAISISLYKDGKPIFYSFEETDQNNAEFSNSKPYGRVGESSFEGFNDQDKMTYIVDLNQTLDSGDSLFGKIVFKSKFNNLAEINTSEERGQESQHGWNLVMANGEVDCSLTLKGFVNDQIEFKGRGYHDHNTGSEPMKESFKEWYWGRYHLENSTLIYYLMRVKDEWKKNVWLFGETGNVEILDHKVEMSNKGFNFFGLESARTFQFEGDGVRAFLQLDQVVDSGPFYQRFIGKVILSRGGKPEQAEGISEYIYPDRIYSRIFWPLVNMRIKYPGVSHWVQQHPKLYRLTW